VHFAARDVFWAWLAATLLSGIPSTLYAFATGGDATAATRAAGAMLLPGETSPGKLFLAAALVHPLVSLFWAVVLAFVLPVRRTLWWAIAAAAIIGVVDLRLIAPAFFPQVAALDFWPQMADHLMWGASFGLTLQLRRKPLQ
jgi:hypothetical protein